MPAFACGNVCVHSIIEISEFLQTDGDNRTIVFWTDSNSLQTLRQIKKETEWIGCMRRVIAVGNDVSVSDAVQLGHLGVLKYFDLPDKREAFVEELVCRYDAWKNARASETKDPVIEDIVIGNSPSIRRLRSLIHKVAPKDRLMVLLRGETGTGKGLVARMLHQYSPRKDKAFVEINCTAIPDGLVEAELFGHEKGAFTDAHRSRKGIFELAHGGTLFLDEIGYLKPDIQVKLLKVLEDRRFRRVGGEKDIQVDCRILTGTSVDLESKTQTGAFRQDLYYRLNVFPIVVPPLRDRGQDILKLADYFRLHYSAEHGADTRGFERSAVEFLLSQPWQGNVRELKHTVERAVILSEDGMITAQTLGGMPLNDTQESALEDGVGDGGSEPEADGVALRISWPEAGLSMDEIQSEVIRQVLELTGGNRSEAARLLNISRSRLLRRINPTNQ